MGRPEVIREWKNYDPKSWITDRLNDIKCECGDTITYDRLHQKLTDGYSSTALEWHCECGVLTEFEVHAIPEFHAYRQSRKT